MACEPNRLRLLCMLALTFAFFVVEVVVSRLTGSLAMLSDSFHMLSDVMALLVALVAVRFARRTQATDKNTFGWVRAEVMGALVNAVFLTALCFTIVLEAVERFTEPNQMESPHVVIGVGAAGLLVNLLGLCMFHGHAGHGHAHGGKKKQKQAERGDPGPGEESNNLVCVTGTNGKEDVTQTSVSDIQMNGGAPYEQEELNEGAESDKGAESGSQLNMRGVFLHVLGDALGSVIVVVNALIFTFVWQPCVPGEDCVNPCVESHCERPLHGNHTQEEELVGAARAGPCWVLYLDPTLCLIMVCILLYTTYPLLKESALILLQTVPKQIDVRRLSERLRRLDGVLAVHELHIWQLAGSRIIATAHIKCHDPAAYMEVAKRLKDFFHHEGIHATTIQPEFVTVPHGASNTSLCELSCRTQCATKLCCGAAADKKVQPNLDVVCETQEAPPTEGKEAESAV